MIKTKVVLGLAMVVAAFAIAATPALARWTNHGGKGEGKAGEGTFTYTGQTVKCESASGTYKISATGEAATLENITWNKCKTSFATEAKVTCKGLEMKQPNKEGTTAGKATGTVTETCTVLTSTECTITVGTTGNSGLESIALTGETTKQSDKIEVKGITAEAKGKGCALGGITKEKTTEAKESVPKLELIGVTLE